MAAAVTAPFEFLIMQVKCFYSRFKDASTFGDSAQDKMYAENCCSLSALLSICHPNKARERPFLLRVQAEGSGIAASISKFFQSYLQPHAH